MDSDTVTWIGTAFSVIGAAIAMQQAWVAGSAAKRAEKARKAIMGKYEHGELGTLDGVLSAAFKAMDKYGPGCRSSSLRGTSPDSDANAVRSFTAALDRHTEMLTKTFGAPCADVRDRINDLLDEFGAAATADERLPKGKAIYLEITTFSGNMKRALDARTFDASAAG